MFASDQASFAINGVAVRVHRGLAVDARMAVIFREAHDAIVGDVAEQQITSGGKIYRPLGPAEAGRDALNCHRAGEGRETGGTERWRPLLGRFEVRVRIAAAGKWSQG